MRAKYWKRIIFIMCVIGLLGFTFWYGGDAPGLQGFQNEENELAADTQKEAEQKTEQKKQEEQNAQTTAESETTQENVFQEIIMHVTKKESASDIKKEKQESKKKASYKQVKANKKAQKNAEKAAKKASKKKKTADSKKQTENKKDDGQASTEKKNSDKIQCTIFISCATVLDNMDRVPAEKQKIIPSDGIILEEVKVSIKKGSTVFDVLQMVTRENKLHLEYTYTPLYKNYYIEGIYNLYEFECGNGSGWLYSVNDEFPGEGCSTYEVDNGDVIKWLYSCDFGEDVGKYYEKQ